MCELLSSEEKHLYKVVGDGILTLDTEVAVKDKAFKEAVEKLFEADLVNKTRRSKDG